MTFWVRYQEGQVGQHQLRGLKGIAFPGSYQFVADLLIKNRELKIKTTQHLDQPLVHEIVRHDDQRAANAPRQPLAMQDEPGFDGLAQTHFVSQQNTWRMAPGDFVSNIKLMGQRLHTRTEQTVGRRYLVAMKPGQGLGTQAEARGFINLTNEQSVQRPIELDEAVEIDFVQAQLRALGIDAEIKCAVVDGLDLGHDQFQTVFATNAITGTVQHAHQGRIVECVGAPVIGRREINHHTAIGHLKYDTQAKLGFGIADPALSCVAIFHSGVNLLGVIERGRILAANRLLAFDGGGHSPLASGQTLRSRRQHPGLKFLR